MHQDKTKTFDIIFLGKETIDYNGSEVGAMVAEILDLPYVSYVSKLDVNGNTFQVTRDIEGGVEVCDVHGAMVLSAAKGLAEQRIPNMKGIMGARTKPLKVLEPVAVDTLTAVAGFELPPAKAGVKLVDPENVEELVRLLHEEAKAI